MPWALVSAAAIVALSDMVVGPIAERFLGAERASKAFETSTHDLGWTLRSLGLVWTFAAFGEELGYRGYLVNRAADLGKRSRLAPAGVVASTVSGLVLGAAYVLTGRNLWVPILAHGFRNTFSVVATLLGWAS